MLLFVPLCGYDIDKCYFCVILLQPTSQINFQDAVLFMKLLRKISKLTGAAVVLTVDQPLPEVKIKQSYCIPNVLPI